MPNFRVILESLAPRLIVVQGTISPEDLNSWSENQTRFPTRKVNEFSEHRQREHCIIDFALHQFNELPKDAIVEFDGHGKPSLSDCEHPFVSISHCTVGTQCIGVVAIGKAPIGCDIERMRPQLNQIAPRFLNETELADFGENLDALCAAWTIKEAFFKAKGTQLDFRQDVSVRWTDTKQAHDIGIETMLFNTVRRCWTRKLTARQIGWEDLDCWIACGLDHSTSA